MNKEWQERFGGESQRVTDASVDEAGNIGFGSAVAPGVMAIEPVDSAPLPVLVELSRLAIIDISGEDAAEFFQAQVCNDLTTLAADQAQLNGYCSPKGRLLALFTVFAHEDGYRLILPDDIAPAFIKRLTMFVLRAKVSIAHQSDLICSAMVLAASDGAQRVSLPDEFPALPESVLSLSSSESVQIVRWHNDSGHSLAPTERARYLCIGTNDALFSLWQSEQFSHAAWPYWRWGDINAGIPNVFASSSDQFIPQMLNMQLVNGLSFKKGCFPGQEIIARMQYLGKLKKHMKHLHQPGVTQAPEPGTTLTTETNNNAGQVVDAVVDEHGLNLLAVVNIETPVSELILAEQGLQEAALPYVLALNVDT